MVDRMNTAVEDLIRSQLQSEEEFTDQRSSYFKLYTAVNFKSMQKKICPKFDLPFGTVVTKLKLFFVVEKSNVPCSTSFRDKLPFVNSTKSLISNLTKILLPRRLILTYSLIAKVMHYQILFTELNSSYWFLSYVLFYLGSHFPS